MTRKHVKNNYIYFSNSFMKKTKILHIDSNHPLLWEQLEKAGFTNEADYNSSKEEIEEKIQNYQGVIIRSRFKIDKNFMDKATQLEFIARVGAGLETSRWGRSGIRSGSLRCCVRKVAPRPRR